MSENKFSSLMNDKIIPPIMKFIGTKPINALRDGMVYVLPFVIIGSIFSILSNIPIPALADFFEKTGWSTFFNQAYNSTFGLMAIWAVVGITYVYVKNEDIEPLPPSLTALSVFIMVQTLQRDNPVSVALRDGIVSNTGKVKMSADAVSANIDKLPDMLQNYISSPITGIIDLAWLGGQGMIAAIIISLLVGWAYTKMIKKGWKITLPAQVPANVASQFTAMIPAGLIIIVSMLVYAATTTFFDSDFLEIIYNSLQTPLQGMSDSLGGALLMGLLTPLFWVFGVHGGVIVSGIMQGILLPSTFDNAALASSGKLSLANGAHIVTNEFFGNWIQLTGSGITMGLLVFMLFAAKSKQMKSIGKLGLIPSLFNINEPIIFGIPIVMNPVLAVPFIISPMMAAVVTYFGIYSGLVPPMNGLAVPFTVPPIIQGFLMGGWRMAILQLVVIVLSVFIYWPFAKKYDQILVKEENQNTNNEEKVE